MRQFIHVTTLAVLFNLLLAEPLFFTASPPALEANEESMAAINIPPIRVDCKSAFQCVGTGEGEKIKIICQCVGKELYRHRTEMPERLQGGNLPTMVAGQFTTWAKPTAIACADTRFPITVEKGTQATNSLGSPRPTTGWGGCLSLVPPLKVDNFTAEIQPTTYLQHSGSIGSTASHPSAFKAPPKPVKSHLPAHDPVITSSSASLSGPWTTAITLVSTVTIFFALAA